MATDTNGKPIAQKRKKFNILVFAYGLTAGTATPLLLSRCAGSGGCGSCGGMCTLAIGIVPLLLFFGFKGKISGAARRFSSIFVKVGRGAARE